MSAIVRFGLPLTFAALGLCASNCADGASPFVQMGGQMTW